MSLDETIQAMKTLSTLELFNLTSEMQVEFADRRMRYLKQTAKLSFLTDREIGQLLERTRSFTLQLNDWAKYALARFELKRTGNTRRFPAVLPTGVDGEYHLYFTDKCIGRELLDSPTTER